MDPENLADFDRRQADLVRLGATALATAGVKLAVERFAGESVGAVAAGSLNPALGALVGALGPVLVAKLVALGATWKGSTS